MRIGIYDREESGKLLTSIIEKYNLKNVLIKRCMDFNSINRTYDLVFVNVDLLENATLEIARLKKKCTKTVLICVLESVEKLNELVVNYEGIDMISKPYQEEYVRMIVKKYYRYQLTVLTIKTRFGENKATKDIPLDQIYYISSDRRVVEIHGKDEVLGKSYVKLNEIEASLPANFIRTHQSYIVNKDYIKKMNWNTIYLIDCKDTVPISRSHLTSVRKNLKNLISSQ